MTRYLSALIPWSPGFNAVVAFLCGVVLGVAIVNAGQCG